jgi:riboflavin synthase
LFTGLVEAIGIIDAIRRDGPGVRLVLRSPVVAEDASIGDSICISGCCLTIVAIEGELLHFDAGEETLSRTILGERKLGDSLNLERSLRAGDRLGGHFVTGHIDAVGSLRLREDDADWSKFWFVAPKELHSQLASKGSIAIDGVSLTLVDIDEHGFSVALIPHTLEVTTLDALKNGDLVNLETDVLAKYVARALQVAE